MAFSTAPVRIPGIRDRALEVILGHPFRTASA